jgi:hypothetical protein
LFCPLLQLSNAFPHIKCRFNARDAGGKHQPLNTPYLATLLFGIPKAIAMNYLTYLLHVTVTLITIFCQKAGFCSLNFFGKVDVPQNM